MESQASSRNGLKRRSKRQVRPLENDYTQSGCSLGSSESCSHYLNGVSRYGLYLRYLANKFQAHRLFVNGMISTDALQNGGMCRAGSNLLTSNAFSALEFGHITILQLSSLNLLPVATLTVDELLNAGYIATYSDVNLLTALGFLAASFGHITVAQLTELNLFPLQAGTVTSDILMEAKYVNPDCFPTALGLEATRTRYIQTTDFSEFGCPVNDYSQVSLNQLSKAKYIYGQFHILTPIGISALQSKFFPVKTFQQANAYPLGIHSQGQWVDSPSEEPNQYTEDRTASLIHNLVQVGYLHSSTYLLTSTAYHAIQAGYFNIEHFRSLKLWPCPMPSTINAFMSAGYITYTGHLTELGTSLLHAQYYSPEWLLKFGVHLHRYYHGLHASFNYGGHVGSPYTTMHRKWFTAPAVGGDIIRAQVKICSRN